MTGQCAGTRVCVFLTRGMSLAAWERNGSLSREMALFDRLVKVGFVVSLVSYGGRRDRLLARPWSGIRVLCNDWRLPQSQYVRWLPWLHGWSLWRSDVIRTNQVDGADVALWSARRWRKPVVVRCGYLKSVVDEHNFGDESPQVKWARTLEERVFTKAAVVQVTTESQRLTVVRRYGVPASNVEVIPNYVDTELFCPRPEITERPRSALFVGRLHAEKNPMAVLDAVEGRDIELTMIGEGPLESTIRKRTESGGLHVRMLGNVSHSELPRFLNETEVFVQPSLVEGHPKTMVEAMACGCAIIASDIPANREVGRDREDCLFCGVDGREIGVAIRTVMQDTALRQRMKSAARQTAVRRFDLNNIVGMEARVLTRAFTGSPG